MENLISLNPATGKKLGEFKKTNERQIKKIVSDAKKKQKEWKKTTINERAGCFKKLSRLIEKEKKKIGSLISQELGKPISQTESDTEGTIRLIEFFCKNIEGFISERKLATRNPKVKSKIKYEPRKTIAIVASWNGPFKQPLWAIVPAIFAGNCVIWKPSEHAPLVSRKLGDLMSKCFPKNVFNIVWGKGTEASKLIRSGVDFVSIAGSTETGRKVAKICSENLIPYSMELGGKDSMIILNDANLDKAAEKAVEDRFSNSGQFCISVEKIYVQNEIYKEFVEVVKEKVKLFKMGDPLDYKTRLGPMKHRAQVDFALRQIKDAKDRGAKIIEGGKVSKLGKNFLEPTIITGVKENMKIFQKETMGPILSISRFDDVEEVINTINDSDYSLGTSIFTKDRNKAEEISSKIEVGMVWINAGKHSDPNVPWVGIKKSGTGCLLGKEGTLQFMNIKVINEGGDS